MSIQFFIVLIGLAWAITWGLRAYALARNVVDVPNERSSHTVPTPRGGGVAIVVTFLIAMLWLSTVHQLDIRLSVAMFGAGFAIAVLGFLDDHGHIHAKWRLLCHFLIAGWAIACLGGVPPIVLLGREFDLGWVANILALLYLVWLTNLYNFMDGIDGIASIEAITCCFSACGIYYLVNLPDLAASPLVLAAAVIGFLVWNFPTARIFMGDAGSGFLGLMLGIISIHAAFSSFNLFYSWIILLGVFVVDATFTLMRRLLRGEKVYEAHRSHAYQYAARHFGKHTSVTIGVMVINLLWLMPLAYMAAVSALDGLLAVSIAYAPLLMLAIKYGAGKAESS
ncbi:MAG: MraY family glycosyltransferase [Pseudomonas sp.]|uniref:MraY family glycosyltransferase n=1 Tax=Pseudomonas TaxID=286 RepID=UPI0005A54FBE|nr:MULTISPECIES: glycosyltransferase family 4 protein [unclassified Pseudomonas]WEZ89958.1 glycosyltransferase family 4 protein [Pseudomonas sp. NyZ480]